MEDTTIKNREEGYYWIYAMGIWSIGQYVSGTWWLIANGDPVHESELQEVGPRITRDVHNHKSVLFTDQFFKEVDNVIEFLSSAPKEDNPFSQPGKKSKFMQRMEEAMKRRQEGN